MSRILLLANLNCDRVLSWPNPWWRGRGCNTWIGAAGSAVGRQHWHRPGVGGTRGYHCLPVGLDETGDWLLEQAAGWPGLQPCGAIWRRDGELLVLVDSTGERTILRRPRRPDLPGDLPTEGVDCLYVNYPAPPSSATCARCSPRASWWPSIPGRQARRPCRAGGLPPDLAEVDDPWLHARQLAGSSWNGWC